MIQKIKRDLRDYGFGSAVVFSLFSIYAFSFVQILTIDEPISWSDIGDDAYLHRLIGFSFKQALFSAALSVILGFAFAHALYSVQFPAKHLILRLTSLTFVLPVLVAVSGLLGVYGLSGWINQLINLFGFNRTFNIYGLSGILIAHLFFNIPLAAKIALQALQAIPNEQHQLAAQLNLRRGAFFRYVEWPYLKGPLLSASALIFTLCFTSFSVVLTLGGGPQYSTLEVAVYQAVFFEFDLPKAALFALIQFIFCLLFFIASQFFSKPIDTKLSQRHLWQAKLSRKAQFYHLAVISVITCFLFTPLLNIVSQGLSSPQLWMIWQNAPLWHALCNSLLLAFSAAGLALAAAFAITLTSRQLRRRHHIKTADALLIGSMTGLAVPTLILAFGLFLALQNQQTTPIHLFIVVVICNALTAMPFIVRILNEPMERNMSYFDDLCRALNIRGWTRFRLIEWPQLKTPMRYSFALAAALSLGDFTAIALFGSPDFTSLPHLLYQQLGQYQTRQAAVTALILLLLCGSLFGIIERNRDIIDD